MAGSRCDRQVTVGRAFKIGFRVGLGGGKIRCLFGLAHLARVRAFR
jgi:hypothetical protein